MRRWLWPLLVLAPLLSPDLRADSDEQRPDASVADRDSPPPPEPPVPQVKLRDVERAIQEAMDRQSGVVPETAPTRQVVDGVPTDKMGESLPDIHAFPVPELLRSPDLFEGQRVLVRGLVRRTASDGSWMEVAEYKSAPVAVCVRLLAGPGWRFFPSTNDRRVTAYGVLERKKLSARDARKLDEAAGDKPKGAARLEWRMEALGVEVQWLD